MNYIVDFSLISIAYLSITAFFYRRQPKVPSTRNTLFGALLYLGVFFAVMDVLVVVMEPFAYLLPAWIYIAVNVVFLISIQLSGVLFFLYCLVLTGYVRTGSRRILILSSIPFLITTLLLILPLGDKGIFYLDDMHVYHRGSLYAVLYVDTALYLLASLTTVLLRRKHLLSRKLLCIFSFLLALFVSMVIQYTLSVILLNAMANALALTLIYHVLEAPSTHVDALTGVLNRSAFPRVVRDTYEQERRCTLFIFSLSSLRLINHSLGMAVGDRLLTEFAGYLRAAFADAHIFRIAGDAFAVLKAGGAYSDRAQCERMLSALPEDFRLGQVTVPLEVSLACINGEDTDDAASMMATQAYILQLDREHRLEPILLADAAFKEKMRAAEALADRLEEAISAEGIEVFFQPLHDCGGALTALEALVRIQDGEGGYLPTQEAVELSERNGSIHRLSELILRRVCAFIRDHGADTWRLHHIGVNLSALQFMRDDLSERISGLVDEYGVPRSLLSFEITETAAASVADISRNMSVMNEAGFSFLLDDFGKGYANFNNLSQLPLLCAKIDKMILWDAMESAERLAFLKGIVGMLKTMELTSVCEGVQTAEQAALLKELGVDMLQGYLFSKPLSPDDLLRYVERMRANGL